jgi:hypothetical protein
MATVGKPDTPGPRKSRVASATRPLDTEWLREHSEQYEGQWVAIVAAQPFRILGVGGVTEPGVAVASAYGHHTCACRGSND